MSQVTWDEMLARLKNFHVSAALEQVDACRAALRAEGVYSSNTDRIRELIDRLDEAEYKVAEARRGVA